MRVGIIGGGTGGLACAILLARDGHDVELFERAADPRPVGAGILLQPLGQAILAEIGLAEPLVDRSAPVRRIEGSTRSGRTVLSFGYADARRAECGLGVHRGVLFALLWAATGTVASRFPGTEILAIHSGDDGWRLRTSDRVRGPFDLVIAADGARSFVRRQLGLAAKDAGYPYGAIWAVVPDPDRLAGDVLWQGYGGTRITLGILPTGVDQASIFWSSPTRELDRTIAAGPRAWVDRALPFAGHLGALVERVADHEIVAARYRDVVVPQPYVASASAGVALVGDAAHAMSPQLGMGASLALADAWSLASALRACARVDDALRCYADLRRSHIRWYTWLSRLMTPVFQSDLVPIGWARDVAFGPMARLAIVRRLFAEILLGEQTSPWSSWAPADAWVAPVP